MSKRINDVEALLTAVGEGLEEFGLRISQYQLSTALLNCRHATVWNENNVHVGQIGFNGHGLYAITRGTQRDFQMSDPDVVSQMARYLNGWR